MLGCLQLIVAALLTGDPGIRLFVTSAGMPAPSWYVYIVEHDRAEEHTGYEPLHVNRRGKHAWACTHALEETSGRPHRTGK